MGLGQRGWGARLLKLGEFEHRGFRGVENIGNKSVDGEKVG